jgi:hypothetical protein
MGLKKILVFTCFIFIVSQLHAQIPEGIIQGFKKGDAGALAGFFNQNIEMVVLEHDDVYSKAQAQQIVSNFFANSKVSDFSIIHDGGKEGARYAVGTLKTATGNFRVYFLLKKSDEKTLIHKLRIEKQ